MITQFKLFENRYQNYKKGDLVILTADNDDFDFLHHLYGKIIENSTDYYGLLHKFQVDHRISDKELNDRRISRCFDVHADFISESFTREEYEELVKQIELEKEAKKYNI